MTEQVNYKLLGKAVVNNSEFKALITDTIKGCLSEVTPPQQENKKENKADEQPKEERVVTHAYQEKSRILNTLTTKQKKSYISKDKLLEDGFPMDYQTALKFFKDNEIGGRPWISYQEQIDVFILPLMDSYKFTKAQKKSKLSSLQEFLQERITKTEENSKLKDYQKKPRIQSLELCWKSVSEALGEI